MADDVKKADRKLAMTSRAGEALAAWMRSNHLGALEPA
jgi:thiamine biosynthesis protein ThiC